jgi:phosphoribosylamine-glycine ligase
MVVHYLPILAYKAVKQIQWEDAYYRNDIGWRAISRMNK